jgi:hypothetical protein
MKVGSGVAGEACVSSPEGSPQQPAPVANRLDGMPSIALVTEVHGQNRYVLVDPAGPYRIGSTGKAVADRGEGLMMIIALVAVLGCGAWGASFGWGWFTGVLFFVLGGIGGFFAAGLLSVPVLGICRRMQESDDRKAQRTTSLSVTPTNGRAWRLCTTAAQIARVGAWQDQTVDRDRRVASIVWAAVERSLIVDRQYADAQQALAHENLKELAEQTLERVRREHESLDAVEANLRKILATAAGIDRRRAQLAEERKLAHRRMLEERELRGRLTGSYGSVSDPFVSDDQADASAGLVAEAETVAALLADSDRMLREIG